MNIEYTNELFVFGEFNYEVYLAMLSAYWYISLEYFGQFPVTIKLHGACKTASQQSMMQFLLSKFGFSIADTSFVFCGHSFLRAILHLLFPKSKQFTTSQILTLPPNAVFMILPKGKAPSLHRSSKYPWYPQGPSSLQIRLQCTMIAIAKEVMLSRTKSVNLMAAHFEVWTGLCLLGIY